MNKLKIFAVLILSIALIGIANAKKQVSVGYVLVGPKMMADGQCDIIKDFNP